MASLMLISLGMVVGALGLTFWKRINARYRKGDVNEWKKLNIRRRSIWYE